jgi:hypothetical protein
MSGRNGDKARFNNYRRRKLAKRQRVWAFFAARQAAPKAGPASAPTRSADTVSTPTASRSKSRGKPTGDDQRPAKHAPAPMREVGSAKASAAGKTAGEKKPRAKTAAKQ